MKTEKPEILVIGDVMLDCYWSGSVVRISPEAPVPVLKMENEEIRLGGAGNVALNAISLGANVHLIATIGCDDDGQRITELLNSNSITHTLEISKTKRTIKKLRANAKNHQLLRLDFEDATIDSHSPKITDRWLDLVNQHDLTILSDYNKGVLNGREQRLIRCAKAFSKPVLVDPKGTDFTKYRGATLIKPNIFEFEAIVGPCRHEQELLQKGKNLRESLYLQHLLITRGEKGMTLFTADAPPKTYPAKAKEVFDITGAGDTVLATIGVALARGLEISEAIRLSNEAAALVVGKFGTATVTFNELNNAVNNRSADLASKICTLQELKTKVKAARAASKKIVFTNGCFDLLHQGHTKYLESAKRLGDILIVGINGDESVRRLKGHPRPLNSLTDRANVLAALQSVDYVIRFEQDTPEHIINEITPDVLVKGGDYDPEDIVGSEFVKSYGGVVLSLDYIQGASTTLLINRLKEKTAEK